MGFLLAKGLLVLLRHGKSVWNSQNRFTGWVDIPLSREGIEEAFAAGELLSKESFDLCFTSTLVRAQTTLFLTLSRNGSDLVPCLIHEDTFRRIHSSEAQKKILPVYATSALNERFYGELQGQNKDEIKTVFGPERFSLWRRSYTGIPPGGESLEMTAGRVIPYFKEKILPHLKEGKKILIAAHGNSLRALMMFLNNVKSEDIPFLEIPTGKPLFFEWDGSFSAG